MQYKLIFLYESDSSHTLSWLCVEERILKLKEKHMLKDFCFPQYYLQEKKEIQNKGKERLELFN